MESEWADGCVTLIQNFFSKVLSLIKSGANFEAEALLRELREPNETHLGLSSGASRGRALGSESAHDVWRALSQSSAAKSGLVEDLEDTVLLIHGISVDIVSDVTTNIIRGPLIEYTQEQAKQLGIPLTEGVPSGPMWNPAKAAWVSSFVDLPLTKTGKLLLVPKAIVRRTSLYDAQYFYRHYMLEHMQREEIKAGSALIKMMKSGPKVHKVDLIKKYGGDKKAIVDQATKNPDIVQKYKKEMGARPFLPMSHEDLGAIEGQAPTDWDALLSAVIRVKTGNDEAQIYEKAVEALLTALLYPDLVHPVYQHEIHERRKRIDIRYTNAGKNGFFEWLSKHFSAPHIFVECKNYGREIANPELDQISSRFGRSRGNVGIIVCRGFKDRVLFERRCRDTALDDRGFVISLDDDDLEELVRGRKENDESSYRQYNLLRTKFDALLS